MVLAVDVLKSNYVGYRLHKDTENYGSKQSIFSERVPRTEAPSPVHDPMDDDA